MKPVSLRLWLLGLMKLIFLLSPMLLVGVEGVGEGVSDGRPRAAAQNSLLLVADRLPEAGRLDGSPVEAIRLPVLQRSQVSSRLHLNRCYDQAKY